MNTITENPLLVLLVSMVLLRSSTLLSTLLEMAAAGKAGNAFK